MPEALAVWDVAIVGGGLAGTAAAIWLARAGKTVLLIEKTVSAHHKVCGEFISIEAQDYLHDLGIQPVQLGAAIVKSVRVSAGHEIATAQLPFKGVSLSRYKLDEALLEIASHSGVTIKRGTAASEIRKTEIGWQITVNNAAPVECRTLFMATGKHELRGWHRPSKTADMIGMKMHMQLAAAQTASLQGYTEIYLCDGGYVGLELIEDGMANLCLVIKKDRFAAAGKNWESLIGHLSQGSPLLASRLQDAKPCWEKPLAIYGIPYGYVANAKATNDALYLLGDQLAVIPSMFGDGMAIALHTAHAACQDYLGTPGYEIMQRRLRRQIQFASLLARLASIEWLQTCLVRLCRVYPRIIVGAAKGTRVQRANGLNCQSRGC